MPPVHILLLHIKILSNNFASTKSVTSAIRGKTTSALAISRNTACKLSADTKDSADTSLAIYVV